MDPVAPSVEDREGRRLKTGEALLRFIQSELEISTTMLDLARVERLQPSDPKGAQQAIDNAQAALSVIHDFLPGLKRLSIDTAGIEKQASELQGRVSAMRESGASLQ